MKKKLIILGTIEFFVSIVSTAVWLFFLAYGVALSNGADNTSYVIIIGINILFSVSAIVAALAQLSIGAFSLESKLGGSTLKTLIKIGKVLTVLGVLGFFISQLFSTFLAFIYLVS